MSVRYKNHGDNINNYGKMLSGLGVPELP